MDREQLRRAEEFIRNLGLTPGQYEKKEHQGGYRLYVTTSRRFQFGYVALRDSGHMIVYARGDFLDPERRFTAQSKNSRDAWYRFGPGDENARTYAAGVVLSAYRSRL